MDGRLLSTISIFSKISSSSCLVCPKFALSAVLHRDCFTNPTVLSNCLPQHGALLKLDFHFVCYLMRYSYIFSSLLILQIHFEAATKVLAFFE